MLTDLITPKHIFWLKKNGGLEWKQGAIYSLGGAHFGYWIEGPKENTPITYHEASCILEHAVRVKLKQLGFYTFPAGKTRSILASVKNAEWSVHDSEPEALIAAMDELIERGKKDAKPN